MAEEAEIFKAAMLNYQTQTAQAQEAYDNAMKLKIEDVLSKYSDDLMDIYFSMDSEIQALSDKEKYLLQAAVDVEKFLYKATGGSVSLGDLSVENTAIHGLPKTLDDLLNNPGGNFSI